MSPTILLVLFSSLLITWTSVTVFAENQDESKIEKCLEASKIGKLCLGAEVNAKIAGFKVKATFNDKTVYETGFLTEAPQEYTTALGQSANLTVKVYDVAVDKAANSGQFKVKGAVKAKNAPNLNLKRTFQFSNGTIHINSGTRHRMPDTWYIFFWIFWMPCISFVFT
ncbi:hypothetical protein QR680_008321 [Steinernema hermaphroditum]|uniref:Uncharacterized protein n=1 Tax=Steinernema hermaphroditum TaxID=289476 RepID=A0AA39M7W4_9BILA|nr:hypothetical protein QR680_008321 [Steinernema hermaphroditum]